MFDHKHISIIVAAGLAFAAPAQAGTISTFAGADDGALITGPFPLSDAAQTSFLAAAAAYGAIDTHDFQSQPLGYSTSNTWFDGSGTFTNTSASTGPGFGIANNSAACGGAAPQLCGFNVGTGDRFLSLAGGTVTFNMTNPTHSFGFFATGIQSVFGNVFTITFNDGTSETLNIPINVNGGAEYFALTDSSAFSSVTISRPPNASGGNDFWGIDDVSLNVVATPLPAALPLFATGLGGLGLLGWRRKRKAQAVA